MDLPRRLAAEALGTMFLLAAVVGSGIMADGLANGNDAVALLANTFATSAILIILIMMFLPVSGAHFNPVVSLVMMIRGDLTFKEFVAYVVVQIGGAVLGVLLAHVMFELPLVTASLNDRSGSAKFISEIVATFGLLGVILSCVHHRKDSIPYAVGAYIGAAYWFTASTSFANPAVTIARCLSDTFAGIQPMNVPGFIVAQIIGALLAAGVFGWILRPSR